MISSLPKIMYVEIDSIKPFLSDKHLVAYCVCYERFRVLISLNLTALPRIVLYEINNKSL